MPVYEFSCKSGHREDKVLRMDARDAPQKCSACSLPMQRLLTAFAIGGEHVSKRLYEYERDKWALATGVKHETAKDISDWAGQNGKTILNPGETLKKVDLAPSDREIERELDKVVAANHNVGEIR